MANAKINLYSIENCGYYNRQNSESFCGISELLTELQLWSSNRELSDTSLHNITQSQEKDLDTPPAYLLDIATNNGIWIISTWNEVPSTKAGGIVCQ